MRTAPITAVLAVFALCVLGFARPVCAAPPAGNSGTYWYSVPDGGHILAPVAAGTFTMGARDDGDDTLIPQSDEYPRHPVLLSAYGIGKYMVTNRQFCDVLNWALAQGYLQDSLGQPWADGSGEVWAHGQLLIDPSGWNEIQFVDGAFTWTIRPAGSDNLSMANHPAIQITWYGAVCFCNWLSQIEQFQPAYDLTTWELIDVTPGIPGLQTSDGYRLPTEAEWERAAAWDGNKHWTYGFMSESMTGQARANYWMADDTYVNPLGLDGWPFTSPVGWFDGVHVSPNGSIATVDSPSPVGCYDMSGNEWEWCHDWYDHDYYQRGSMINPTGPTTGTYRVIRGGEWGDVADVARTAARNWDDPTFAGTGKCAFRIARTGYRAGSLQVFIEPPEAVAAGAQWKPLGTTDWLDSGARETGLVTTQTCTIQFKHVYGWVEQTDLTVPIIAYQTVITTGTYTIIPPPTGDLKVMIEPAAAVSAGAKWRRVGTGSWLDSGATETGLSTGTYSVQFLAEAGWITPNVQSVQILANQTTLTTGTYVTMPADTGALQVFLTPDGAISAGAHWRRTGTLSWLDSGATESGLTAGTYTVEFEAASGWVTPGSQDVPVVAGETASATGIYTQVGGSTGELKVVLTPPGAISAGAHWRRHGTATWLDSGATETGIAVGNCTVDFETTIGWLAPPSQSIAILANQTSLTTGTYVQVPDGTGAIQVVISPPEAVSAGAQWRRTGTTPWLDSGYTETGLAPGAATIEFKVLAGWLTPDDQDVQVLAGQTTAVTGAYINFATGALADYKVSYKGCDVARDGTGLDVTPLAGFKSSVKIQRLKKRPASVADVPGKCLYLLHSPGIERLEVTGSLTTLYTDAPVGLLDAKGFVGAISSKNAAIASVAVTGPVTSMRMAATPVSPNPAWNVTRVVTGGNGGQSMAIGLTGIVLQSLQTNQAVSTLGLASKSYRNPASGATGVARAGAGRIAPGAADDASGNYTVAAAGFGAIAAKGANIRPDMVVSEGPVGKITGKALYLGGIASPAMIGWGSDPTATLMKADSFAWISADSGVHGLFWAGFDSQGPTYTGSIGTVATKAGMGTLSGEVCVAPGTAVNFVPDQGDMHWYTSN